MILCKFMQSDFKQVFNTAQQSICVTLETSSLRFPIGYFNFPLFSYMVPSLLLHLEAVFFHFLSMVAAPVCVIGPHDTFSGTPPTSYSSKFNHTFSARSFSSTCNRAQDFIPCYPSLTALSFHHATINLSQKLYFAVFILSPRVHLLIHSMPTQLMYHYFMERSFLTK